MLAVALGELELAGVCRALRLLFRLMRVSNSRTTVGMVHVMGWP